MMIIVSDDAVDDVNDDKNKNEYNQCLFINKLMEIEISNFKIIRYTR
jgi:hypothetical protein